MGIKIDFSPNLPFMDRRTVPGGFPADVQQKYVYFFVNSDFNVHMVENYKQVATLEVI